MGKKQIFQGDAGLLIFFLSGIRTIGSGVVVSMLQEIYGFAYSMTGVLLSLMGIGNLLASFASGTLPAKIGAKKTVVLLTTGYGAGYLIMGFSGWILVLVLDPFLVSVAKGSTIDTCTILVADNFGDRTKDMNIMRSCYALDTLSCPFFIGTVMKVGSTIPTLVLTSCGFLP